MGIVGLFKSELQKLFSTKTIIFTLIGLLLIPIVYAAILLSSTWGPYDYKDNLPVAVVNNDKGAESDGEPINVGNDLVETLKEGKALGWDFVSQEEANKGLKENKYYMVIEIPEDFSQKVTTVLDANPQVPEIKYIRNEGMNFMASQVTNSAVEKIREQLGDKITATFATKVFNRFPDIANGFLSGADGAKQIKDGTIQLADGTNTMLSSLQQKAPDINRLAAGAKQADAGAGTLLSSVQGGTGDINRLADGSNQVLGGLKDLDNGIGKISNGVNQLSAGIKTVPTQFANKFAPAYAEQFSNTYANQFANQFSTAFTTGFMKGQGNVPGFEAKLQAGIDQVVSGVETVVKQEFSASKAEMVNKADGAFTLYKNGVSTVVDTVVGNMDTTFDGQLSAQFNTYKNDIKALINSSSLDSATFEQRTDILLNTLDTIFTQVTNGSKTALTSNINSITDDLKTNLLSEVSTKLDNGEQKLVAGVEGALNTLFKPQVVKNVEEGLEQNLKTALNTNIKSSLNTNVESSLKTAISTNLATGIQPIIAGFEGTKDQQGLLSGINSASQGVDKLVAGQSQIAAGTNKLVNSWSTLTNGIRQLKDGTAQIADGNQTVATGWNTLIDGTTKLNEGAGKLRDGSDQLATGLDGGYKQVSAVKASDDNINMIASPVKLTGEDVNKYEYYRDSTAPYILSLSLFVTLLISSFFIDFKKPASTPSSAISWFISKWLILALFAIVEALLVSLFALVALKLSVTNPGLFILFAMFVSVTFMSIILFFVAIGQRVGRFLALAFIVLQLSITGANLPIPMLPDYLRSLTKFLPLTYSNTGFNSVINLGDSSLLAQNATVLLIYLVVTTLIALAIFLFNFKSIKAPQVQAQAIEA